MIDVALTPSDMRSSDVAVVIDVLRATSTATQALAAGYQRVLCAESVEGAIGLRSPGRVLAGECDCVMPPGFDQGNSPLQAMQRRGDELVLATTNGTPTIVAATHCASTVLLACVLNLAAALEALHENCAGGDFDVQVVCSGSYGRPALEDVYVAGRLCAVLAGRRTDTARIAQAVATRYRTAREALDASAHAAVLRAAGLADDIAHCAIESRLEAVGQVQPATGGFAAATPWGVYEAGALTPALP